MISNGRIEAAGERMTNCFPQVSAVDQYVMNKTITSNVDTFPTPFHKCPNHSLIRALQTWRHHVYVQRLRWTLRYKFPGSCNATCKRLWAILQSGWTSCWCSSRIKWYVRWSIIDHRCEILITILLSRQSAFLYTFKTSLKPRFH